MVDCLQPTVADTVADPACCTGGFLLEAYRYASAGPLTLEHRTRLRTGSGTVWSSSTGPLGWRP